MTLEVAIPSIRYAGNGVTTALAVPYPFYAATDLLLTRIDSATGSTATLALGVDYAVDGGNGEPGTVTMAVPPAAGLSIIIDRATPLAQGTTLQNYGPLAAKTVEATLDRAVAMIQDLTVVTLRSLRVPPGDSGEGLILPDRATRGNTIIGFDINGDLTVNVDLSAIHVVEVQEAIAVVQQIADQAADNAALVNGVLAAAVGIKVTIFPPAPVATFLDSRGIEGHSAVRQDGHRLGTVVWKGKPREGYTVIADALSGAEFMRFSNRTGRITSGSLVSFFKTATDDPRISVFSVGADGIAFAALLKNGQSAPALRGGFTPVEIAQWNAEQANATAALMANFPFGVQPPNAQRNITMVLGQSQAKVRTIETLTNTTPTPGVFSVGPQAQRSAGDDTNWQSSAGNVLMPLVSAGAQNGLGILGTRAFAEALFEFRGQTSSTNPALADPAFVVVDCTVGGKRLIQLSPGGASVAPDYLEYYNQVPTSLAAAMAACAGKTVVVDTVLFGQGESDLPTPRTSAATYEAQFAAYRAAVNADIRAATGQTKDPLWIIQQPGGQWRNERLVDGGSPQAQINITVANPQNTALVTYYDCPKVGLPGGDDDVGEDPTTPQNGHIIGIGGDIQGCRMARARFDIHILKRAQPPFIMKTARLRGRYGLVGAQNPYSPIVIKQPFIARDKGDIVNWGLCFQDQVGDLPVVSKQVIASEMLLYEFDRLPIGDTYALLGQHSSTLGFTMIASSDARLMRGRWKYLPNPPYSPGMDIRNNNAEQLARTSFEPQTFIALGRMLMTRV